MCEALPIISHTYFDFMLDYEGDTFIFLQDYCVPSYGKYLGLVFPQHVTLYLGLRQVCPLL